MKKYIQFIVLPVICLFLATALAVVYNITAPIIAEVEKAAATEARKEVLATADDFTQVEKEFSEDLGVVDVYEATNGAGYAVQIITKGYGGDITLMVGLDADLNVSGAKILTHGETAGLGAKTAEPEFLNQFVGKGGTITAAKNQASNDNEIVTVASATISSKAVTLGINNAITAATQAK